MSQFFVAGSFSGSRLAHWLTDFVEYLFFNELRVAHGWLIGSLAQIGERYLTFGVVSHILHPAGMAKRICEPPETSLEKPWKELDS